MIDTLSKGQITHVGVGLVFGLIIGTMIYAFGHVRDLIAAKINQFLARSPALSLERLYAAGQAEAQS